MARPKKATTSTIEDVESTASVASTESVENEVSKIFNLVDSKRINCAIEALVNSHVELVESRISGDETAKEENVVSGVMKARKEVKEQEEARRRRR